MKITFLYILISASIFSCGQSKSKTQPKEKPTISSATEFDTTSIVKTPERLKGIVKNIAAINEVHTQ